MTDTPSGISLGIFTWEYYPVSSLADDAFRRAKSSGWRIVQVGMWGKHVYQLMHSDRFIELIHDNKIKLIMTFNGSISRYVLTSLTELADELEQVLGVAEVHVDRAQGHGQRRADDHRRPDVAGGLRVAPERLHRAADRHADAEARADRAEAALELARGPADDARWN